MTTHNIIGQAALATLSIRPTQSSEEREPNMTDTPEYTPPEVWVWEKGDSPNWRYSHTNRPIAGATHDKALPRGKHPLQLYLLGTPNGVKVTIMLEELLAAGHSGAEYDAWLIRIGEGDQFGSGFVGATAGYALVMQGVGREVVLVDKDAARSEAEADDIDVRRSTR